MNSSEPSSVVEPPGRDDEGPEPAAGSGPGRPVQIYQTVPSPAMADYASRSIADELLGVMV